MALPPEDSDYERHLEGSIGKILGSDFATVDVDVDIELTLDKWRASVEGRELVNEVYPVSVDQLFTLLFTNSKFYLDFHANRKTFGKSKLSLIKDFYLQNFKFSHMNQTPWTPKGDNESEKVREVSFTLSLTHPMGPKHSQVIETQVHTHNFLYN